MGLCTSAPRDSTANTGNKPVKAEEKVSVQAEAKVADKKPEAAKVEEKKPEEPKVEEKKPEEPKVEEKKPEAQEKKAEVSPAGSPSSDHHVPKKPEGAQENHPEFGALVTDGKCYFYEAAFQQEGVYKTRDEEVAMLNKALDVKKEAGAATAEANKLHDSGDIEGSKPFRAEAKAKHAESLDLEIKVALSMAKKAQYAPEPEIDYHVFLLQGFTDSWPQALELVKANKLGAKKFLVIPGAGSHSQKDVGPKIKPALLEWFKENNVTYTEETHGSYLMDL